MADWCKDCRTHHYNGAKCYPDWEVQDAEYNGEDEWSTCKASDASEAAQQFVEDYDDDRILVDANYGQKVQVRKVGESKITEFEVWAEVSIDYTAHEIEEDK